MSAPRRNILFFQSIGLALVCLVVGVSSFLLLDQVIN